MEKSSRACWTDLRIGILNFVIIAEKGERWGSQWKRGRSPMDCKGGKLGKFYIRTEGSWSKYNKYNKYKGRGVEEILQPQTKHFTCGWGGCLFSANHTSSSCLQRERGTIFTAVNLQFIFTHHHHHTCV
jgi:hypothetical protein